MGTAGTIIEVERWDVKEMARNSHDWKPIDDIRDVLLEDLAPEIRENELGRILPKTEPPMSEQGNAFVEQAKALGLDPAEARKTLSLPKKNGDDRPNDSK